jgi:hypothetical protein
MYFNLQKKEMLAVSIGKCNNLVVGSGLHYVKTACKRNNYNTCISKKVRAEFLKFCL